MFWRAAYSFLKAESFSCSLDVLKTLDPDWFSAWNAGSGSGSMIQIGRSCRLVLVRTGKGVSIITEMLTCFWSEWKSSISRPLKGQAAREENVRFSEVLWDNLELNTYYQCIKFFHRSRSGLFPQCCKSRISREFNKARRIRSLWEKKCIYISWRSGFLYFLWIRGSQWKGWIFREWKREEVLGSRTFFPLYSILHPIHDHQKSRIKRICSFWSKKEFFFQL